MTIPLLKPNPPKIEEFSKYLEKSYEKSTFSNGGPCAVLLESRLKSYIGLPETPVLMSNATVALTVALQALGLQGSEVLVPSFTFSATGHSIINALCKPVLVDIDYDLVLDLKDAEKKIGANTKALVVVQPLGFVCNYKRYEEFAKKHELKLIFDSAAALGASYEDGSKVGIAGDCEVFSLHITKTFGIGEGGLITSKDHQILKKARQISNFGFDERGHSVCLGSNTKCSDFHAAVGLATLDTIDQKISAKKMIADLYDANFAGTNVQSLSWCRIGGQQVYPIMLANQKTRDMVVEKLKEKGIGSRIYYIPLHTQPFFADIATGSYPVSDDVASRILCIPFFETLSSSEIAMISDIILENT